MPRILVIDDQKDVRTMICMVLRVNHFDVVEAESAAVGLNLFGDTDIDVAIVDIFLEDANGFDVIARLRDRNPGLPVVAISGMTSLAAASQTAELHDVTCLQKPFRPNQLIQAIDAARELIRQAA
jgi:DNA-binding response OmpR family regulator